MGDRQWVVLYVLVCLEVGIFLMLVPWSAIWERNYFLEAYPSLRPIVLDPVFRGAVAGLGLGNVYLGISEVFHRRQASLRGGFHDGELSLRAHPQGSVHRGGETDPPEAQPLAARQDRT